ncbi:MAG TPA: hypothetical protein VFX39_03685 [Gemmatimonadaceae bacterium]|nr:hypothetical protein [Gemmatimonadaceae bacterium]
MNVLVMLGEDPASTTLVAHVNSVPTSHGASHASREVVTLYGDPSAESLALALAAAVESRRADRGARGAIHRHLGVWEERGAVGDEAWHDAATGQLVTRDLDIPIATLLATAQASLGECGHAIKGLLAGLRMPEWPEGTRRALLFSLDPAFALPAGRAARTDSLLAAMREADGMHHEIEGD